MTQKSETRTIVKIWVACTNDATSELRTVKAIAKELNEEVAPSHGLMLEVLHYTSHTHPGWGRPQQVIFDQMPQEDIFFGILRDRLGSPTGAARSGVLEEFQRAVDRYERDGSPKIMFYVGRQSFSANSVESSESRTDVLRFRDSIKLLGLLAEFSTPKDFEILVRRHLTQIIVRWRSPAKTLPRELSPQALLKWLAGRPGPAAFAVHSDIQGFKNLNRLHGSAACDDIRDAYILAAAQVAFDSAGVLARIGGDEVVTIFESALDATTFALGFQHHVHRLSHDHRVDVRARLAIHDLAAPTSSAAAIHSALAGLRTFSLIASGAQTIATAAVIDELKQALGDDEPAAHLEVHGLAIGWFDHGLIEHRRARVRVWELLNLTIGQGAGRLHHEQKAFRVGSTDPWIES